jgi:branched-chain amino acid transport system ATP-binding protein
MTSKRAPLLAVDSVSAFYGRVEAMKSVSMRVQDGELVAVLGPNGAGKSTLMKAITRLIKSTGSIIFNGEPIQGLRTDQLAGRGIALVPEGRGILDMMTVAENLELGAYARFGRGARNEIESDYEMVFGLFPRLKQRFRQLAGSLSGGEQQMVAVGRALMARPRLLLLDEPSLGLAPRVSEEIFQVLKQLNEKGVSIILVEQKAPWALQLASRAYVLRNGNLIRTLNPQEISSPQDLSSLYLGSVH